MSNEKNCARKFSFFMCKSLVGIIICMQHVIQISKEVLEINLYFLYLRSPNVSVQRRGSTPLGERRRTRSASPAITDTTRVAVGSVQAALHKR